MESTKNSYEKLLRKFESDADKVLSLLTSKSVIKEIESNEDGEPVYQEQKLIYYSREIQFFKNHGAEMIKSIIFIQKLLLIILLVMVTQYFLMSAVCLTQLFGPSEMIPTRMKKFFLFSSLQSTAFLKDSSSFPFLNLLRASRYKVDVRIPYAMPIIYFAVDKIKPMNLWSNICLGNKEKQSWHDIILLVELCLCTPFSNATLERFFREVEKTEIRSRLSSESLNSVITILMKGLSITVFQENYSNDCVDYWYNSRSQRLNQQKRKNYEDRKATKKQ